MFTRKEFHAVVAPAIKAAHRYTNNYILCQKPNPRPAGVVSSHSETPANGLVEFEGFTIEISMSRRPRVVCNVPTPFSLYTFNYCLKREGKQLCHGTTLPEFIDNVFRVFRREGLAR